MDAAVAALIGVPLIPWLLHYAQKPRAAWIALAVIALAYLQGHLGMFA